MEPVRLERGLRGLRESRQLLADMRLIKCFRWAYVFSMI